MDALEEEFRYTRFPWAESIRRGHPFHLEIIARIQGNSTTFPVTVLPQQGETRDLNETVVYEIIQPRFSHPKKMVGGILSDELAKLLNFISKGVNVQEPRN